MAGAANSCGRDLFFTSTFLYTAYVCKRYRAAVSICGRRDSLNYGLSSSLCYLLLRDVFLLFRVSF